MASVEKDAVEGRNGVVITRRPLRNPDGSGYRTYEVHQRERVGESTEKIKPIELASDKYRIDPYPYLEILRENYPFYRDWLANSYWVTRYNDVTSIFADDANFETRTNAWHYGLSDFGRNLNMELPVLEAEAQHIDSHVEAAAAQLSETMLNASSPDLATQFCAQLPMLLLAGRYGIPAADHDRFISLFWRMARGVSWNPQLQKDGRIAIQDLIELIEPLLATRRDDIGDDMISAMLNVIPDLKAEDVVATLLETDHQTLHGTLANLWFNLLNSPDEFAKARSDRRLMKLAYLETLRHSPAVLSAHRFARHEVERFGKLIPQGARLVCSAAAANRDPRIFKDPDRFIVDRKDLCQREPRGQYRADGLATGIAFALGKPSVFPAVPEDRPRSRYAITRDTAVTASMTLLDVVKNIQLAADADPKLMSLTNGEMHTCWRLPVTLNS